MVTVMAGRAYAAAMIYILLAILLWLFFQTLSIVNDWGGVVGYLVEPLLLAGVLAGAIALISEHAAPGDDRDVVRPHS
jgi:hypothetical protein